MAPKAVLAVLVLILASLASASTLQVTEEHPFLLDGSWVEARELEAGDLLQTADGGLVRITSIRRVEEPVTVYNLEAGVFHDFVAGLSKIVVHNSERLRDRFNPFRRQAAENVNYGRVYERQWSTRRPFGGRYERIAIDDIDSALKSRIQDVYDQTVGRLPKNPTVDELEEALMRFNFRAQNEMPFLGYENFAEFSSKVRDAELIRVWDRYLGIFDGDAVKLSELVESRMLDCTGQHLAVQQSIPGDWKLYYDVPVEGGELLTGKTRVHTFLAKQYELKTGEPVIAMIDTTEVSIRGSVMDFERFMSIYPEAGFVTP